MVDDFFCTVTPWRVTSCGSCAMAACTRLFTLMVFWSGSVPMAKVTVMVSEPLDALADCRYSMLSTPLICVSSGAATDLAMVSADAPG